MPAQGGGPSAGRDASGPTRPAVRLASVTLAFIGQNRYSSRPRFAWRLSRPGRRSRPASRRRRGPRTADHLIATLKPAERRGNAYDESEPRDHRHEDRHDADLRREGRGPPLHRGAGGLRRRRQADAREGRLQRPRARPRRAQGEAHEQAARRRSSRRPARPRSASCASCAPRRSTSPSSRSGRRCASIEIFEVGQFVDAQGITRGRGFSGVVRRWSMAGGGPDRTAPTSTAATAARSAPT